MARLQVAYEWFVACSRWGFKAATLSAFVVHFVLTLLYVSPPNPLKVPITGLLDATVGVYARQNWSLFAPDPVASNQDLLAKCLTSEDVKSEMNALAGQHRTDGWSDISMPFWIAFQKNRFTAYDRLVRPQTNTVRTYLSGGHNVTLWGKACEQKNDKEACEVYEKGLKAAREGSEPALRKIGSAFCQDYERDRAITHVALRVRLTPAVPWSQRRNTNYANPPSDINLGVFPIDKTVATTGLFRRSLRP